ncbi:hypothetical protein NE604_00770 [Anaerofustis stercorihominis]|uniref:hypothetical protein n=1 Tax=Anaerofustis stercorihominis TaxID=214853 RepID=UPI00210D4091|nr:hypothetical protein [Anaerofustis stercorihominis]MCQ4794176.1 hypothetical protein [Anaerofustis stercorihominis]
MGVEYYKRKAVPLFESIKCHRNNTYGLAAAESGQGYYLYELLDENIELRAHLNVVKGTLLELETNGESFGVHIFDSHGNDEGFMKLPI